MFDDRPGLILDEEPLAAVVVEVVATEVEAIAAPDRLQAVRVVAVLADAGDLVGFDQDAVGIPVGAIVVAVEPDRVLTEGSHEPVVSNRRVRDVRRGGGPRIDPEPASADPVEGDRDLRRAREDVDVVPHLEAGQREMTAGELRPLDRSPARVAGSQGDLGALPPPQGDPAVGAVGQADDPSRFGAADRGSGARGARYDPVAGAAMRTRVSFCGDRLPARASGQDQDREGADTA